MTEISASAGSEGYAACDDEAKDMQLATTTGAYFVLYAVPSMMRKGLKAVTSVTVPSASVSVYFTP